MIFFLGWPLLSGQENERRRVIRSEALWPEFDLAGQSKGIQIALQGLGRMEPVSAARVELATAVLNSMVETGDLNATGGWLKQETSINQSCLAWAKLAVAAARKQHGEVWKRAKAEAERLAPISSLREGRAGWVLLYEGALLVSPEDAVRYLAKLPSNDFESQSDLKGIRIRRIGEGLDAKMNERELTLLLAPPPTQASLDLMAYALRLVDVLRSGACQNGRVAFSAVAGQAVKCALESAANPAPVLVAVLAEAERSGESVSMMDDWFEKATRFLEMANLDEEKPSYLLELAKVAEGRGDLDGQKHFLAACEKGLQGLEPALQPEGYLRLGQTHVRQGEPDQAWEIWKELLGQLERNPNHDLRFQLSGEIALEIDRWLGDVAELKASALAEMEARMGGSN
jgi:hypothetical protein